MNKKLLYMGLIILLVLFCPLLLNSTNGLAIFDILGIIIMIVNIYVLRKNVVDNWALIVLFVYNIINLLFYV